MVGDNVVPILDAVGCVAARRHGLDRVPPTATSRRRLLLAAPASSVGRRVISKLRTRVYLYVPACVSPALRSRRRPRLGPPTGRFGPVLDSRHARVDSSLTAGLVPTKPSCGGTSGRLRSRGTAVPGRKNNSSRKGLVVELFHFDLARRRAIPVRRFYTVT